LHSTIRQVVGSSLCVLIRPNKFLVRDVSLTVESCITDVDRQTVPTSLLEKRPAIPKVKVAIKKHGIMKLVKKSFSKYEYYVLS
jgi:hypothetical protein